MSAKWREQFSGYHWVKRTPGCRDSVVRVRGLAIGGGEFVVMAGPCSVETERQLMHTAEAVALAGARVLRGGAFKPRSSPYSFQGLGLDGLKLLAKARANTGLAIVTEVMSEADVDLVAEYADIMQVGSRNMEHFSLLERLGSCGRPVVLKRGMVATIHDVLRSAECIATHGNRDILLCELSQQLFLAATSIRRCHRQQRTRDPIRPEDHLLAVVPPRTLDSGLKLAALDLLKRCLYSQRSESAAVPRSPSNPRYVFAGCLFASFTSLPLLCFSLLLCAPAVVVAAVSDAPQTKTGKASHAPLSMLSPLAAEIQDRLSSLEQAKRADDPKAVKQASRALAAIALGRTGQLSVLLGDSPKAQEAFNRSIEFEDAPATHLDLCAAYLAANKPSDCLTETARVILQDPQNAAAWRVQSEAWKMEGDSAHAESSLKQAESLPSNLQDFPRALIPLAKLSPAQRTKLKREQSDLATILANALNDLGTTEARETNFRLALTHFHEAEKWQPALTGLQRNIGMAADRVQDYPEAVHALRQVVAANPSDQLARTILGTALFSTNAFAEAAQVFSPLGDSALNEPGVAYAWVESLIKLKRFSQATALLDKWQQFPLTADTYILIAQARSQMGDYPHAVAACRRALALDANTPNAHYIAALALLRDGHSQEAEADLRAELELDPNSEETQYNLAFVLLQQSRAEEAVPWLEKVVAEDPNHAQANYELGKQLLSDGKTDEAAKYLEVAARLTPNLAHVHYQLQSAYRTLGRRADADRELQIYKAIKEKIREPQTDANQ